MKYVPIITWKKGERDALNELPKESKSSIAPCIVIPPIDIDFETKEPKKNFTEHVAKLAEQVNESLSEVEFFYLDSHNLQDQLIDEEKCPTTYIIDLLKSDDVKHFIPVIDKTDYENIDLIKRINTECENGICLRVTDEDFLEFPDLLTIFTDEYNIDPKNLHIIFDIGLISKSNFNALAMGTAATISVIHDLNQFGSVVLASTSFDSTRVTTDSIEYIDRFEIRLYNLIVNRYKWMKDILWYGDYGIDVASDFLFDPRMMQVSANIRYSTETQYVFLKGHSIRKEKMGTQILRLCKNLVAMTDIFMGNDFSWGDNRIYEIATKMTEKRGNATTWRSIGTNHHIQLSISMLSNLGDV